VTGKVKVKGRVYFLKPCPHCHRKWRLSQKSATVAENGEKTATVSRTFLRQSHFSTTVVVFVAEIGDSVDRL